jgi:hypothetical protein
MTFLDRGTDVDALRTDRYLELLLSADTGAADAPSDPEMDRSIRDAAARLRRYLAPVRPSFRFEERLANRLADAARAMRLADAAGSEGAAIPFRPLPLRGVFLDEEPEGGARNRPLIIGGALTSAALSLAGAAFVAWRRTRGPRPVRQVDRGLD